MRPFSVLTILFLSHILMGVVFLSEAYSAFNFSKSLKILPDSFSFSDYLITTIRIEYLLQILAFIVVSTFTIILLRIVRKN